ncbi:MAG: hypothetical protein AAF664_20195 [Planctomycetota bacterium]
MRTRTHNRSLRFESLQSRQVMAASLGAEFVDIDYSPEFSDASENQFIATVKREDGVMETYVMGSEGSDRSLVATTALNSNGKPHDRLLSGVVGQAFGPDIDGRGNDFAYAKQLDGKVQVWRGEQKVGRDGSFDVKYHQRGRFEVPGTFVDLDYSSEFSTDT